MDRLLQQFEKPVTKSNGDTFDVFVYGRSRPADTWQGWLVFERRGDLARFSTDVETTQPNAEAILYWATGLTDAYFDGALDRARQLRLDDPLPEARRMELELAILDFFRERQIVRAPTRLLLAHLPHEHADIIRALEDMIRHGRLLERRTEEGSHWLFLREPGIRITRATSRHDERAKHGPG